MKDIEFRAWDKEWKLMSGIVNIRNGIDFFHFKNDDPPHVRSFSHPALIIEQFIGRKDKNGKKIFKGDIIHSNLTGITYIVVFNEGEGYEGVEISGKNYYLPYTQMNDHTVIGNIHENPELLNSNKDNNI